MRLINIDSLREGMQAGQDLYDEHNRLMLGRGAVIKRPYVARLKTMGVPALYIQEADTSDIAVPETIPPAARAKAVQNLTSTFSAVTQSLEGLRQLSLDEAHQHVRSKKFVDTFKSATGNQGIDQIVGDVDTLVDQIMNKEVVLGLNSIKTHDSYTFQHSIDVTIMGLILARKIGWPKERLMVFGVGCLLHDIGKIFIESEILNKPGRLSDTEYETMKSHPTLGYELVRTIAPNANILVSHVAYQHHERQDGSGYPRGIVGNEKLGQNESGTIHDFGAVAAVADIYDAMASDRPYRHGWPTDRVVGLIRDLSGSHLNPKIVDIFQCTVAPYPIGTCIRIQTGAYTGCEGVIADIDDLQLDRPIVRLLFDTEGNRMDALEIDLRQEEDLTIGSIPSGGPELEPLGSSKTIVSVLDQAEIDRPIQPAHPLQTLCTQCGFENKTKAKFCSECGTALPRPNACTSCGQINKPTAKFCSECGTQL